MELKFKSIGSTSEFVTWLKGFKDIMPSLLIEVDLNTNEFIAKSFPPEKTIVKYSKISFDEAGLELSAILDNDGKSFDWQNHNSETSGRINIGIYETLAKLIDVENMFSSTDHDFNISFDICNNVMYVGAKQAEKVYMATSITLKSMSLTMVIKCSSLSDFFSKCDDNTFLTRVCNIGSPSTYEVSIDTLINLSKISSVFNDAKERNIIKFYSKEVDGQWALYAYDETGGAYDYLLGYYVSGEAGKTAMTIFKDTFLNATKGLNDEDILNMTLDTAGASRMLIEANNSKVVVAASQK